MSECLDLLRSLRERGIELWLAGDRLLYRAAKTTITPEELTALKRMKQDVAAVLRYGAVPTTDAQMLAERRPRDLAPITLQQEWIWNAIQSGAACYLDTAALRLQGTLDHEVMRLAVERLLHRHDSLRTAIVTIEGTPRQRILAPRPFHLELVDIGNSSPFEQDEIVQQVSQQLGNQQCDLAVGPLFDARLLRITKQDHVLMWAIHHIIADGFSLGLMFRELWLLYEQLSQGRSSDGWNTPLQYSEYAAWQRDTASARVNDTYWSTRLVGAIGIRWREAAFTSGEAGSFEYVPIALGCDASKRLRKIAAEAGTTLGMSALAIYIAALSRWCDQTDLTVAVTVTGRDRPDLETMAGYCAHALFLRIRVAVQESFSDLLRQVTHEFYDALSHQDFGKAVADAQELFSRALFQWTPWPTRELAEYSQPSAAARLDFKCTPWPLRATPIQRNPFSQYAIIPMLWESEEGVVGAIFYQPSSAAAMPHFAQELRNAAEQLTQTSHTLLASYVSRRE